MRIKTELVNKYIHGQHLKSYQKIRADWTKKESVDNNRPGKAVVMPPIQLECPVSGCQHLTQGSNLIKGPLMLKLICRQDHWTGRFFSFPQDLEPVELAERMVDRHLRAQHSPPPQPESPSFLFESGDAGLSEYRNDKKYSHDYSSALPTNTGRCKLNSMADEEKFELSGRRRNESESQWSQASSLLTQQSRLSDRSHKNHINSENAGFSDDPVVLEEEFSENSSTNRYIVQKGSVQLSSKSFCSSSRRWKIITFSVLAAIVAAIVVLSVVLLTGKPDTVEQIIKSEVAREIKSTIKQVGEIPAKLLPRLSPKSLDSSVGLDQEFVVLAGGEQGGQLVNTVEIFPPSTGLDCIPALPVPLKLGSLGLVAGQLLLCGGQNSANQPVRNCWRLDKTAGWEVVDSLTSPRSQAAAALVGAGSKMVLISGYSSPLPGHHHQPRALPSLQVLGDAGADPELQLSPPYHARLAAATALQSGNILVTGGKGSEEKVVLISANNLTAWLGRAGLNTGRFAHSSAAITLGEAGERVIVAGGFTAAALVTDTVEIYNPQEDNWQYLLHLPTPRAYFNLQVCLRQ